MPVELSSEETQGWKKRIAAAWRIKAVFGVVLPILFCVPYFLLEHFPIVEPRTFPLSWIDRAIPFQPGWVIAYQSIYLLINTIPWMGRSREDMGRYLRGFLILCSISFALFLFFPVAGPRPQAVPGNRMYRLLISYDGSLNAFPSLHAGLLVYTIFFAWRVAGNASRGIVFGVLLLWSAMILYATMAIKEHYAVDLVAGMLLAIVCDWLAWEKAAIGRPNRSHVELVAASRKRLSSSGRMSLRGSR